MTLSAAPSYSERRHLSSALFQQPFLSRWIFDVEILARLIKARRGTELPQPEQTIYEFPLTEWKDIPGSKLEYGDFVRAAWELYRIRNFYFKNPNSETSYPPNARARSPIFITFLYVE